MKKKSIGLLDTGGWSKPALPSKGIERLFVVRKEVYTTWSWDRFSIKEGLLILAGVADDEMTVEELVVICFGISRGGTKP